MADWIKQGERIEAVRHYRQFDWPGEPNCGYAFTCDEQGNLVSDSGAPINSSAMDNYQQCLTGAIDGRTILDRGVTEDRWTYWEPGVLRCVCGAELVIEMLMTNTCERCARDYSSSGQLLAPREQWGWDTGESLSDILMSDERLT